MHVFSGLMKVMTATHSIQGANVTVSEVVASESCHFLLTQKPTDPEILGIQTELQRMGVHAVESSASFDQLMKQQAQKSEFKLIKHIRVRSLQTAVWLW